MSNKKSGNMTGKGYYIALILCAVAIGISGYLYYRNTNKPGEQLAKQPSSNVDSGSTDVQAVATQPAGNNDAQSTDPSSEATLPPKTMKTAAPVSGETVMGYAMDCLSYNQTTRDWRTHNGIDIVAEAGTKVCAAAEGTVYSVYEDDTMGMTVVLQHTDGYTTRYSSLSEQVSVKPGDTVTLGQALGTVGQTALLETAIGDHVHFSVACNGQSVDPSVFLQAE